MLIKSYLLLHCRRHGILRRWRRSRRRSWRFSRRWVRLGLKDSIRRRVRVWVRVRVGLRTRLIARERERKWLWEWERECFLDIFGNLQFSLTLTGPYLWFYSGILFSNLIPSKLIFLSLSILHISAQKRKLKAAAEEGDTKGAKRARRLAEDSAAVGQRSMNSFVRTGQSTNQRASSAKSESSKIDYIVCHPLSSSPFPPLFYFSCFLLFYSPLLFTSLLFSSLLSCSLLFSATLYCYFLLIAPTRLFNSIIALTYRKTQQSILL